MEKECVVNRQNIIDLIAAVVKPVKIYGRWNGGSCWQDPLGYLHLVIIIDNKRQEAFKDIDPLIGLAKLGDEKLTCSLYQLDHIRERLITGHLFLSAICVSANLIYDDGTVVIEPTNNVVWDALVIDAAKEFRSGLQRAHGFVAGAKYYRDNCLESSMPCFMLHQAAEIIYRTAILVQYGMNLRTHSLIELQKHTRVCAPKLNDCLPAVTDDDRWLISRLDAAYTAARYSDNFEVAEYLIVAAFSCVELLLNTATVICDERFLVDDVQSIALAERMTFV